MSGASPGAPYLGEQQQINIRQRSIRKGGKEKKEREIEREAAMMMKRPRRESGTCGGWRV